MSEALAANQDQVALWNDASGRTWEKCAAADGIDTATFVQADAQTHAFDPGSFDAMISRFGVMFFDAPEAAFGGLY